MLATPVGNAILRSVLGPLRPALPFPVSRRLPFRGKVAVRLAANRAITFQSDGRDWIAARLYWNGPTSFEPETTAVIDALLPRARCVFDVGAYSGWYALRAAAAGHSPEVHAFEAVPDTHRRLVANAEQNGLGNLRAVWAAVGATTGETHIHAPSGPDLPTSASTLEGFRPRTETLVVPAITLDGYCLHAGVSAPDLVKIDVEGGEPSVLEGARETIRSARPFIVCEVLAGLHEPLLQEFFRPLRYLAFHIGAEGPREVREVHGDPSYRAMNYLFLPEEKRAAAGLRLPP